MVRVAGAEHPPPIELSWRGKLMGRRCWWLVRPFVNVFTGVLWVFLWDPPIETPPKG